MYLAADPGMRLLEALNERAQSPADLARHLGTREVELEQTLQQLQAAGATLDIRPGRVALAGGFRPLDVRRLGRDQALRSTAGLNSISVLASCQSTNTRALGMQALPGAVLAEYQTAGRGRRQRRWLAPFGSSLLLSLAWPVSKQPAHLSVLPLIAGAGILQALRKFGAAGIGLKWPNDLWCQGRKLAGILVESRIAPGGRSGAVIGVGINVDMRRADGFDPDAKWVDLTAVMGGKAIDRTSLGVGIIAALAEVFQHWVCGNVSDLLAVWREADVLCGKPVQVSDRGRSIRRGIARGVGDDGALRLDTGGAVEWVHYGDVSVTAMATADDGVR